MKKNKEWAQKEIDRYLSYEGVNEAKHALALAKGVINQLDEPEILSQEWIYEHKKGMFMDSKGRKKDFVWVEDLQNLLVPKGQLPTIPKFVAEYLDERKEYPIYKLLDSHLIYDIHDELASWLYYNDKKTNKERELSLVLAHIYGYTVEKEQKYYARIKGWENVTTGSEAFNWVYFKEKDTVGISKAVENKYQAVSFTKYEWNNLGINEHNADFVLVEEIE